ncbi:MAG: helix-turn-helix transcriptional regulator [Ruminococcaceae bacterium]|nr:helix-turn-helix transcriptional regulator [Oscillospiraceae bacterium]
MQKNYLQKLVITNLKKIIDFYKLNSIAGFAEVIGIKSSTVKSWLSFDRCPKIKTLDNISDKLNIPTYFLFLENFLPTDEMIKPGIANDSSRALKNNLKKIYKNLDKNSWNEISSIYSGLLSIDTLKSYQRRDERSIMPPIKTLEKLSSYLGIPASEILKGDNDGEN